MSDEVLDVWMDGAEQIAGRLASLESGEIGFFYDEGYIEEGGLPLSISLPLADLEFGDVQTRAFFANLLPENTQLQRIMEREGLARTDVVGLLKHLGADCAGAVSCLPRGAPPVKTPGVLETDYEPLDDRLVVKIVRSLQEERRLPADVSDPSPVAGVQSKIAVALLPDKRFALPRPGLRVPTTHILKVPERGRGRDARLEEAATLLATAAGLDACVSETVKIGDIETLLIERFDRRVVDGVVTRVHQEDFAQALGLPSELKYQRRGAPGRWFSVDAILTVLDATRSAKASRLTFLRSILFNLSIGNTDNHAKNYGLLYDDGPIPRLAPLYDLMPIRIDNHYTHELAFQVGAAKAFDDMTAADLAGLLRAFGVDDLAAFIETDVAPMVDALEHAARRLRSIGLKTFDDLIGREMERLVGLLSLAISLRERDYFGEGGGWAQGS